MKLSVYTYNNDSILMEKSHSNFWERFSVGHSTLWYMGSSFQPGRESHGHVTESQFTWDSLYKTAYKFWLPCYDLLQGKQTDTMHYIGVSIKIPRDNLMEVNSICFKEELKWMNFLVRTFWRSSTTDIVKLPRSSSQHAVLETGKLESCLYII